MLVECGIFVGYLMFYDYYIGLVLDDDGVVFIGVIDKCSVYGCWIGCNFDVLCVFGDG